MYLVSENDDDAKELVFKKYKPIITKMAKLFYEQAKDCGLTVEDFIQEGYYALACAVSNYSDKDSMFYTYALISIKSKMRNLVNKNRTLKNMALNTSCSLYIQPNIDKDGILLDIIEDPNEVLPDVELEKRELIDAFKELLYELPIDDSIVLELKWNGFSYPEISKLLNINIKKIGYILNKVKKKLNNIH